MTDIPAEVLAHLVRMDGYDLMLELDTVGRQYGISVEDLKLQLEQYKIHGTTNRPLVETLPGFEPTPVKEMVDLTGAQNMSRSPRYIDQPDKFRMRYNPSHEGLEHQSQVRQAIMCESCGSPLGIPDIRPIEVTCPNCGAKALYST